jgi:hypothetical protein
MVAAQSPALPLHPGEGLKATSSRLKLGKKPLKMRPLSDLITSGYGASFEDEFKKPQFR